MSTLLILLSVGGVLYGLWLLMAFTFNMLDIHHALVREERLRAADSRNNGREQTEEKAY